MKNLFFILFFFCVCFCCSPTTRAAEVSYGGGNFYLPISKIPYQVNKKIILSSKAFFKIEEGVIINFGSEADVCFSEKECLMGDWILKNGLKSCSVVFESLFFVYTDAGAGKTTFQFSKNGDNEYSQKIKETASLLKSLDSNIVFAKLKIGQEEYSFRFLLDMISASGDSAKGGSFLIPSEFSPSISGFTKSSSSQSSVGSEDIYFLDKIFSQQKGGLIFLEVQRNGEAWYVNPLNYQRYYLGRPTDAFSVMKALGLGVKHQVIQDGIFSDKLSGRILIDVEDMGRAYYVSPKNKKAYYLGRPEDAFKVMMDLGVGIRNADIRKIEIGKI